MEGVRLFGEEELNSKGLSREEGMFEQGVQTESKQARHTAATARIVEADLKNCMCIYTS